MHAGDDLTRTIKHMMDSLEKATTQKSEREQWGMSCFEGTLFVGGFEGKPKGTHPSWVPSRKDRQPSSANRNCCRDVACPSRKRGCQCDVPTLDTSSTMTWVCVSLGDLPKWWLSLWFPLKSHKRGTREKHTHFWSLQAARLHSIFILYPKSWSKCLVVEARHRLCGAPVLHVGGTSRQAVSSCSC